MKSRLGKLTAASVLVFTTGLVLAHSGGLDRCGGHHDRKNGGYHVHNKAKYCACHPDAELCKPKKKDNEAKSK